MTRTQRLRQDLTSIYRDGMAFSVMVGAGETYIAAFALALGMAQITAGLGFDGQTNRQSGTAHVQGVRPKEFNHSATFKS